MVHNADMKNGKETQLINGTRIFTLNSLRLIFSPPPPLFRGQVLLLRVAHLSFQLWRARQPTWTGGDATEPSYLTYEEAE